MKRTVKMWARASQRTNVPMYLYRHRSTAICEQEMFEVVIPVTVTYDDGTHRRAQRKVAPKKR